MKDHGLRPESWKHPVDRLLADEEKAIREKLSEKEPMSKAESDKPHTKDATDDHVFPEDQRDAALEKISRILAVYRHEKMHRPQTAPTVAEERGSLEQFINCAKKLQQAWNALPHTTKINIHAPGTKKSSRNVEPYALETTLEDHLERAKLALSTITNEEVIESGAIVTRPRPQNQFKGAPRKNSKREVLKELCDVWLLHSKAGLKAIESEELPRGAVQRVTDLTNHMIATICPGDTEIDKKLVEVALPIRLATLTAASND